MIEVIAAIIERGGKFLIARRKEGAYAGFWEFPGGKLEAGETHQQCIARELSEELGIVCEIREFIAESIFNYGEGMHVRLSAYAARHLTGDFVLNVHSDMRWIEKHEFADFNFPPADVPIIAEILRRG